MAAVNVTTQLTKDERNPIKAAQADAQACIDAGDIRGAEQVWKRFAEGEYDR